MAGEEVAIEPRTILTLEIEGPVSALMALIDAADGSDNDPFLNINAYLHGVTHNMSVYIKSAYMEEPEGEGGT